MRKLKLDVDTLQVQTFETSDDADLYGTVQAFDVTTGGPHHCAAACDTVSGPCDRVCADDTAGYCTFDFC
jgi:hypothetical protein